MLSDPFNFEEKACVEMGLFLIANFANLKFSACTHATHVH